MYHKWQHTIPLLKMHVVNYRSVYVVVTFHVWSRMYYATIMAAIHPRIANRNRLVPLIPYFCQYLYVYYLTS